ncbi:hypothetical protein GGI35DRAFT_91766 [Trichoderma velutinum]
MPRCLVHEAVNVAGTLAAPFAGSPLQKPRCRQFGRIGHTASRVSTSIMHDRSRLQHSSRRVNRSQPMPMDPDPEAEFYMESVPFFAIHTPHLPIALRRRTPGLPEGRVSNSCSCIITRFVF